MKSVKGITKKIIPSVTMVAGGVAASKGAGMLSNTIKDDKLRFGALMLAGILIGSSKGETMKNLGAGMVTVSGMKLVGALAPKLGIGLAGDDDAMFDDVVNDDVVNDDVVNGYTDDGTDY